MRKFIIYLFALLAFPVFSGDISCGNLRLGVYYYPGWGLDSIFIQSDPWERIKKYENIKPAKGYYWDGSGAVVSQQIDEMIFAGFDYVVYDWYWTFGRGVGLDNSITTFRRVNKRRSNPIKYFIMWANRSGSPANEDDFKSMINYIVDTYFSDDFYEKINKMPVIMIYDYKRFIADASKFGGDAAKLIKYAKHYAASKGFNGIYFIAGGAYEYLLSGGSDFIGIDAVSDYNYHNSRPDDNGRRRLSYSYDELVDGYYSNWEFINSRVLLPYWVPATSGWDRRPWGGSSDPRHDRSIGSPSSYLEHVQSAINFSIKNSVEFRDARVTVCCWNEYGEGSIVEPTVGNGNEFLMATYNARANYNCK
ncbi:glycoside hydrolase family 99-like domain-containing protein [Sphaerotilus sulfidivorans]|nr:hypothetical protein CQA4T8M7_13100 [Sphaerotilus natans]